MSFPFAVNGSSQVELSWSPLTTKSGFPIKYQIFQSKCLLKEIGCNYGGAIISPYPHHIHSHFSLIRTLSLLKILCGLLNRLDYWINLHRNFDSCFHLALIFVRISEYRNSSISPNHLIIRTPIIICDNNFRIKSNKSNIIVFATFFFVNQQ